MNDELSQNNEVVKQFLESEELLKNGSSVELESQKELPKGATDFVALKGDDGKALSPLVISLRQEAVTEFNKRQQRSLKEIMKLRALGLNAVPASSYFKYPTFSGYMEFKDNILTDDQIKQVMSSISGYIKSPVTGKNIKYNICDGLGVFMGKKRGEKLGVETLDLDFKNYSNQEKADENWGMFLDACRDQIEDFDNKVAIYKSATKGYHLIYLCKKVESDKKLAWTITDEGKKLITFETKGQGGFVVFRPDNKYGSISYDKLREITPEDRDLIFDIAMSFCEVASLENSIAIEKAKEKRPNSSVAKARLHKGHVWSTDAYNAVVDVWDLIKNEFTIVRTLPNGDREILRNGSDAAKSGYIYYDTGKMYLYTPNAGYEERTPYSPSDVRMIQEGLTRREIGAKLLKEGYGTSIKEEDFSEPEYIKGKELEFPIDIFPKEYADYFKEYSEKLNAPLQWLGSGFLWVLSTIIGNSLNSQFLIGWREIPTVWICFLGEAGIGKSKVMRALTDRLLQHNQDKMSEYDIAFAKYEEYESKSEKEKKGIPKVVLPRTGQFSGSDTTIEALNKIHNQNKHSFSVFYDEGIDWEESMAVGDRSNRGKWLSSWAGMPILGNRVGTGKGNNTINIKKPCIPVLMGIQPEVIKDIYTPKNIANGFMARLLVAYCNDEIPLINRNQIDYKFIKFYNDEVVSMYEYFRNEVTQEDKETGDITPFYIKATEVAIDRYVDYCNELVMIQRNKKEHAYIRSLMAKMRSYTARFALMINALDNYSKSEAVVNDITLESVEKAIRLSNYFIHQARIGFIESKVDRDVEEIVTGKGSFTEKAIQILKLDTGLTHQQIADELGCKVVSVKKASQKLKSMEENI